MPSLILNREEKMDQTKLDIFYKENYTLDRVIIAASGVDDHQEFCKLVEERIELLTDLHMESKKRERSEYVGGRL